MAHAAEHGDHEAGTAYGAMILSYDRASEVTYRRLMKLRCEAGDRTGALRQYQRCVTALREELGVKPERRTQQLYEQIKADGVADPSEVSDRLESGLSLALPSLLGRLKVYITSWRPRRTAYNATSVQSNRP